MVEASLKGLIVTSTPDLYYYNGINGTYTDFGLDANSAINYIANSADVYNPTNAFSQIIKQKRIGNFNVVFEGWIEYRRTGIPAFDATSANLNGEKISCWFGYTTDEQSINKINYTTEIALQGGTDNANYKAWWKK